MFTVYSYIKLFISGARIDHGHHGNKPERALYDVLALEKAVNAAISKTHFQETLMIVTADHSHVFDIAGYPNRGANILGNLILNSCFFL